MCPNPGLAPDCLLNLISGPFPPQWCVSAHLALLRPLDSPSPVLHQVVYVSSDLTWIAPFASVQLGRTSPRRPLVMAKLGEAPLLIFYLNAVGFFSEHLPHV